MSHVQHVHVVNPEPISRQIKLTGVAGRTRETFIADTAPRAASVLTVAVDARAAGPAIAFPRIAVFARVAGVTLAPEECPSQVAVALAVEAAQATACDIC